MSMPVVGRHSTNYKNLEANLYSVVRQLVEGVAFMHKNGVAHLDLKPQNVLVNEASGRLWIIDFSISEIVESVDVVYEGFAGTKGHAAPEVSPGLYSPIRADIWSCGKVIQELCERCGPSMDRDFLLRVSEKLMVEDPQERPELSAVVTWLSGSLNINGENGRTRVHKFEVENSKPIIVV